MRMNFAAPKKINGYITVLGLFSKQKDATAFRISGVCVVFLGSIILMLGRNIQIKSLGAMESRIDPINAMIEKAEIDHIKVTIIGNVATILDSAAKLSDYSKM